MSNHHSSDLEFLRAEIAAAAARMIAEDGADYGTAKRKAANQILGNRRPRGDMLPDNAQIEEEVRIYNELFLSDTQPARLLTLRRIAAEVMENLSRFNPYLTGAVANGTAGAHSDIHLQLFSDNPKEVMMHLLNQHINFDTTETPHFKGNIRPVETLSFLWKQEGVHLALYQTDDLRGGVVRSSETKQPERLSLQAVRAMIVSQEK